MEKIELKDTVDKLYNDLILQCLTFDSMKRPSFSQLEKHEIFEAFSQASI